jgi:hypothetical protein
MVLTSFRNPGNFPVFFKSKPTVVIRNLSYLATAESSLVAHVFGDEIDKNNLEKLILEHFTTFMRRNFKKSHNLPQLKDFDIKLMVQRAFDEISGRNRALPTDTTFLSFWKWFIGIENLIKEVKRLTFHLIFFRYLHYGARVTYMGTLILKQPNSC